MAAPTSAKSTWGSAIALPLLLALAGTLSAVNFGPGPSESPNMAAGVRWLSGGDTLAAPPQSLGLPATPSQWLLYGGGATLTKPNLRGQAGAWTGGLRANSGADVTAWDLHLAELSMEQTYPRGTLLVTAGATVNYAELHGSLTGPLGHSSVRAPLWGGGVTTGVRWPRQTALGFYVRGSWLWLSGMGDWRGDQAAKLGSHRFDLSGPSVTGQVELNF